MKQSTAEERANATLTASEQARLLDLTRDAVISRSIDGAILFWNAGAEKMYGWTRDEALGKKLHTFLKTKFPEPFSQITEKLLRTGEWRGELVQTRKDGTIVTVFSRKDLARDADGKPVSVLESNTDVTQQKQIQEALKRSEHQLRSFVESTTNLLWRTNARGEVDEPIPSWNDFTGQTEAESAGFGWVQAIHPEDRPHVLAAWEKTKAAKTIYQAQYRLKNRTGEWREVISRGVSVLDSNGNLLEYVGSCNDITEQRRAEAEVREREAVLRTIANEARVGLVMVDKDRRYIFANRTYVDMHRLPDSNIIGKRVPDVLGPLWEQVGPQMEHAFAGERSSFELRVPAEHQAGTDRIFEIIYEPRLTDTANPYVVVVIFDVTERKQMQQTLEEAVAARTSELRQTNEQLEAFVYSIAHDLRAPLRAMQGYSEILLEEGAGLPERSRSHLNRINNSAQLMDRMILDLLAFGRVAHAGIELVRVPVEAAWRDAVHQTRHEIEQTNARIEIVSELLTVCAHKPTLTQVLANLLSNAIKFVGPDQTPHIRFCCQDRGEYIRLWIEDNGIGIDPLYHERIFRVFERLEGSKYPGTGVGLAIVRKGVERMNGRFGLESALGKGTQFWIELPKP